MDDDCVDIAWLPLNDSDGIGLCSGVLGVTVKASAFVGTEVAGGGTVGFAVGDGVGSGMTKPMSGVARLVGLAVESGAIGAAVSTSSSSASGSYSKVARFWSSTADPYTSVTG